MHAWRWRAVARPSKVLRYDITHAGPHGYSTLVTLSCHMYNGQLMQAQWTKGGIANLRTQLIKRKQQHNDKLIIIGDEWIVWLKKMIRWRCLPAISLLAMCTTEPPFLISAQRRRRNSSASPSLQQCCFCQQNITIHHRESPPVPICSSGYLGFQEARTIFVNQ